MKLAVISGRGSRTLMAPWVLQPVAAPIALDGVEIRFDDVVVSDNRDLVFE